MSDQIDAFAEPIVPGVPTTQEKPTRAPWWFEVAARQQLGKGDDWELASIESIGPRGDALVSGSVVVKSRSGKRTWSKPLQKCVVTRADADRVQTEYEAQTGTCGDCGGDGLVLRSASFREAVAKYEYATCKRCAGLGRKIAMAAA